MIAQIDRRYTKQSLIKSYTRYLSYFLYEGRPLTTKGRWINPLIFFLYKLQSLLPLTKPVNKPIFIIGSGRSGTTILGTTLSMHNAVGFLNEPKALWNYLYDSEDLIGSYNTTKAHYRLNGNNVTNTMVEKAHRIYGNYLRFACASRVVDKYPELIFRTEFINTIFPDACFLFLYRNGYDTCHSIRKWSDNLGSNVQGEVHNWWGRDDRKWKLLCFQVVAMDSSLGSHINEISQYSDHSYRAAVEWIVTMKEGLKLLAQKPNHVMGVKYEDYISCPETRLNVLRFCNLDVDSNYEEFCDKVLDAPKVKPRLTLPPVIQNEFHQVMKRLGYDS